MAKYAACRLLPPPPPGTYRWRASKERPTPARSRRGSCSAARSCSRWSSSAASRASPIPGLSIVEWQPIVGTLPPLSEGDWQQAFAQVPADTGVPRGQRRDDARGVQGHFLVGIRAPTARPRDRRRVSACRLRCSPRDGGSRKATAWTLARHLRARRAAGRDGLVHGAKRPRRRSTRLAVSPDGASWPRAPDLCVDAVDRAVDRVPAPHGRPRGARTLGAPVGDRRLAASSSP